MDNYPIRYRPQTANYGSKATYWPATGTVTDSVPRADVPGAKCPLPLESDRRSGNTVKILLDNEDDMKFKSYTGMLRKIRAPASPCIPVRVQAGQGQGGRLPTSPARGRIGPAACVPFVAAGCFPGGKVYPDLRLSWVRAGPSRRAPPAVRREAKEALGQTSPHGRHPQHQPRAALLLLPPSQDCSRAQPCDHTKGLECNFGASPAALKGICRAQSEGRPCEYNSKIYQNGESFQPNCKHQCTCIDGAVGCIPLCPQELSLPNLGCPSPRLVKVPGQCCEEWVCDESKDVLDELEGFFSKEFGLDDSEGELTRNNELIAIVKGGLKMLPVFGSEPQSRAFENPKCIVQTTSWSQCSKTCGTGISTRVTNDNPDCKLIKETRICEVRPCGEPSYASLKKGKKCTKTRKSPSPVKFTYAGCSSVKKYRPKYCGSCVDGRCCTPQQTRTVKIRFRCDDGETFTKSVMMIQSCRCSYNCPHANEAYPYYRLVNDIHKFRD
ncbi:CCN family member 1 [Egretta garzetta]|uniref:CCN family member 1 n=1 Tax=Egretta garzetta TaxID=188379 RepID=UPI00163C9069|nr:CCN family member 1 [Egretta garzetta]